VKWLSNLMQGKTSCLTCRPWSEVNQAGRAAIIAQRKALALETEEGRVCHTCGEWKRWERFANDKRRASGKSSNCYDCGRWRTLETIFGITKSDFLDLLHKQGGVCGLCGEDEQKNTRLSVDHDHSCCGRNRGCKQCIRGLLCDICNRLLGQVERKPRVAARFADYLEQRPFASVAALGADALLEDV
jgi:hypothetical protein